MSQISTFEKQRDRHEREALDARWKQFRKDRLTAEQREEKRLLDVAYRNWESARMTDADRFRIGEALKGRA